jgi:hypothetical protein
VLNSTRRCWVVSFAIPFQRHEGFDHILDVDWRMGFDLIEKYVSKAIKIEREMTKPLPSSTYNPHSDGKRSYAPCNMRTERDNFVKHTKRPPSHPNKQCSVS